MSNSENNKVPVPVHLEQDQYAFLDEIAQGLKTDVATLVENAVIAAILGAAYPKDEARIHYVTAQARVDKWRRGTRRASVA